MTKPKEKKWKNMLDLFPSEKEAEDLDPEDAEAVGAGRFYKPVEINDPNGC